MPHSSFCLNPDCFSPQNKPQDIFCITCGSPTTAHGKPHSFFYGKYLVKNLLKEGRLGREYLAIANDPPQRNCIIRKIIPSTQHHLGNTNLRQLFDQEAQQLLKLKHPQLPQIYDYLSYDLNGKPHFYLIREKIEGKNLQQIWQALGNFSPAQIRSILLRLLPVLDHLHQQNIIHCNIKPRNIFLQENTGQLILLGAGSQRLVLKTTLIGAMDCTPLEASLGKPSPASDLYSLAATCVRLMTGIFPQYDPWGNVEQDLLFHVTEGKWQWRLQAQQQGLDIPESLGKILDNLLQPFAKDRHQTATEVLQLLTRTATIQSAHSPKKTVLSTAQPPQKSPQKPASTSNQVTTQNPLLGRLKKVFHHHPASASSDSPSSQQQPSTKSVSQSQPKSAPVPPRTTVSKMPPTELVRRNFIEELGKGIRLEMVAIPLGSFTDEFGNAIKIRSPFYLGKYPITQAQWIAIMGNNPSFVKNPHHPVECVTWEDCQNFLSKLRKATGKPYRLPSETEWEYCCRAVTSSQMPVTKYYFGDDQNLLGDYAWYSENANHKTHPVGEKKPNRFGLYDMYGNVGEWCADDWRVDYAGMRTQAVFVDKLSKDKVVRGGSWLFNEVDCCSAYRYWWSPERWSHDLGLRVVCELVKVV